MTASDNDRHETSFHQQLETFARRLRHAGVTVAYDPGDPPAVQLARLQDAVFAALPPQEIPGQPAEASPQHLEKLESRLRACTDALETANQELDAFTYSVSHDLRAPLRGIDGFSRILLNNYAARLDATGQDYLNRVRHAAVRLRGMIDDLLHLSRIGRAALHRAPVDLSALAATIAEELRGRDPDRQVAIQIAPGLQAFGDRVLLRTALEQLLANAWKFTEHTADPGIEVGAVVLDGEQVFYVRDNGAGIDMRHADRLFTPFGRLHDDDRFPGSGIGLAVVHRIISRHGGRVRAEGAEEEGATFYFTLGGTA